MRNLEIKENSRFLFYIIRLGCQYGLGFTAKKVDQIQDIIHNKMYD